MKSIVTFIFILTSLISHEQNMNSESLVYKINKDIEKEVESVISKSQYSKMSKDLLIYENKLIADFFENDLLTMTTRDTDKNPKPRRSL